MSKSQVINKIKELAEKKTFSEEDPHATIMDVCGGNYDDAYYVGLEEGEIYLARNLLKILEK